MHGNNYLCIFVYLSRILSGYINHLILFVQICSASDVALNFFETATTATVVIYDVNVQLYYACAACCGAQEGRVFTFVQSFAEAATIENDEELAHALFVDVISEDIDVVLTEELLQTGRITHFLDDLTESQTLSRLCHLLLQNLNPSHPAWPLILVIE